jgi:amino acid adenylation domain-containing protein
VNEEENSSVSEPSLASGQTSPPRRPGLHRRFVPFRRGEIEQSIPARFESFAARHPGRVAIRTGEDQLSYADLNGRANCIAASILAQRGTASEPVTFLLPQGVLAIATILGILKAGKFYVPLDPTWTGSRIGELIRELQARLVLTDGEHWPSLAERAGSARVLDVSAIDSSAASHNPGLSIAPDDLAYVYYTSGTTGRPKGVMDSHRNVLHNVMRYTNALRITEDDRLSLLQSCGFSGAVSSVFVALLNGACSCPLDLRAVTPRELADWIDEQAVTIYHSVPAIFRSFLYGERRFPTVRVIRLEGDRASRADLELYKRHFGPGCVVAVGLGTTETGLVCQYFFDHTMAIPEGVVPIGWPVEDVAFLVKDGRGEDSGVGEAGEIVVRSAYLAPGYWNDPEATAGAFSPATSDSRERLYRTGDLGRLRPDGCLEYLGRIDARVKVRGQWVELADVEASLAGIRGVRECVVVACAEEDSDPHLVAYLVPAVQPGPTASELRRTLAETLPQHMIPRSFVTLEQMPLSPNGKVDRAALPPPGGERPRLATEWVPPRNLVQQKLTQLWEDLLTIRPVGIEDDFFELGGDSLLAAVMMGRVEELFHRRIPLSTLLKGATVEHLAFAIVQDATEPQPAVVSLRSGGSRTPFFFLHGDYLSGGFYCLELARRLDRDQPFFVLPPCGLDGQEIPRSYEAMAERHLGAIRSLLPRGPYLLGGLCNGGLVAYEMARRLEAEGESVSTLVLVGASAANVRYRRLRRRMRFLGELVQWHPQTETYVFRRVRDFFAHQEGMSPVKRFAHVLRKTRIATRELVRLASRLGGGATAEVEGGLDPGELSPRGYREGIWEIYQRLDREYVPQEYGGRVVVLWPEEDPTPASTVVDEWKRVAPGAQLRPIRGDHTTSLTRHVATLADTVSACLSEASEGKG